MGAELQRLRAHAIGHSLFPATGLAAAISRLGFVQADPIRAPARAQDLILRHRVRDYRAGDLERRFASLAIEEDVLYAYGFLARPVAELLHPRPAARPSALEREVLAAVGELGEVHPATLVARFGARRVTNGWGGQSQATTRALERLQTRGLVRVVRRDHGVRVYQLAPAPAAARPPADRLRRLIVAVADVLAPVPERTLLRIAAHRRRSIPRALDHRAVVRDLRASGELAARTVGGVTYLWPRGTEPAGASPPRVRFLAPFDPVVWDRARFEQLFGWSYRFEAYTPPARRVRGYYAMPMVWGEQVIGWANASVVGGALRVELGFAGARPRAPGFRREVDAEIARLAEFVGSS